ncbi:pyridoxal phosphate-dependent aminotransferase [Jiangella endophytica]|uniref:pyridoxal phosphate-dependent aminotransferase n=1 Tax=Jiangella endophytica TaxID=1623398 RepID=UPI000E341636|nr:pyridoxal phosphate-dependent aminotransferase [Jiangella endophytica]
MTSPAATWRPAGRADDLRAASLRPALAPPPPGAVSLAMGDPDFATPAAIVDAAAQALRDGHTHYADQQGHPSLRAAIAERLPGARSWTASDVLVTHGATAGLASLILATVNPGDRVVIPEPAYSLYADLVVLAGGRAVHVPLARSLHWDLDRLHAALPGARLVIFSNPANPTGVVHTRDELRALAAMLEGSDTLVVADEAYHRFVYAGHEFCSALSVDALAHRTVYVQTFSKTYAMTGWRVGYLVGPRPVVEAAALVHRTVNGSVNTAAQIAAVSALSLDDAALRPMLEAYEQRRNLVADELSGANGVALVPPEGGFYAFVRYEGDHPSVDVTLGLRDHGVIVRAGSEYGPSGEGHVRISFAAGADDLRTGLHRMRSYFDRRLRSTT